MMTHHRLSSDATSRLLSAIVAVLGLFVGACSDLAPTSPTTAKPFDSSAPSFDRATPTFSFSTIDVPGAFLTSPQGINGGGDISGWYVDMSTRFHGFILHEGTFTTIDYPGADNTDVRGIAPNGDVVGRHWNNNEEPVVASHGFKRTAEGEFQSVHYPDHLYEIPQRILADGTILGCRHDHDLMGSMDGIMIEGTNATEIHENASMNNGGAPNGHHVVGLYTDMMSGFTEGYMIDGGVFTPFMVPGSDFTTAWDVNPRGDIVGVYHNATGFHGYVRTEAGYTTLDAPGAAATRVFGINARGDVVGTYVAGGRTHGYLATRDRPAGS
jgi:hypothetical protein